MAGEFSLLSILLYVGQIAHVTNITTRDGHYGLWMDSSLEKGVSASCQTFGNEPLSDEGIKFDILGVEVWYVGS